MRTLRSRVNKKSLLSNCYIFWYNIVRVHTVLLLHTVWAMNNVVLLLYNLAPYEHAQIQNIIICNGWKKQDNWSYFQKRPSIWSNTIFTRSLSNWTMYLLPKNLYKLFHEKLSEEFNRRHNGFLSELHNGFNSECKWSVWILTEEFNRRHSTEANTRHLQNSPLWHLLNS